MSQKKAIILNEPPLKDLTRLSRAQVVVVGLKVRRRTANNREMIIWAYKRDYPLEHISNGQLERDLMEHSGGGNYIVQMFDNDNALEPLSPRWSVPIDGQPFDPNTRPQNAPHPGMGGMGGGLGSMPGLGGMPRSPYMAPQTIGGVRVPASAISAGFPMPPLNTQGEILGPPPPNLMSNGEMQHHDYRTQWQNVFDSASVPGGALDPAHQVSVDFANKFDDRREATIAENARLHAEIAATKESHVERMFALQSQNQGGGMATVMPMMLQMLQQGAQQQQQASQQQMAMMMAMMTREQPKSGFDANMLAALAAALVPVATAFITHGSSRHQTDTQAQMKQQEIQLQQQQAFQQMFLQGQQKSMDIPGLIAATAPILATVVSARHGSAELAMQRQDMSTQNSMMQLKMLGDIIAERAQDSGNPDLADMVMRFVGDIMPQVPQVISSMRGGGGGPKPAQRPTAALPAAVGGVPPVDLTPTQQAVMQRARELIQATDVDANTSAASWAGLLELDDNAAEATAWVLSEQLAKMGPGFNTIPWREAVFHAHHLSEPALTAARFRAVIDDAYEGGLFPQILMNALRDDTRKVLSSVMNNMPVAEVHPEYVTQVLDVFMAQLEVDQQAGAVERAQEAVVAPKPTPPAAPTAQQAQGLAPTVSATTTKPAPAPAPATVVSLAPAAADDDLDQDEGDEDDFDDDDLDGDEGDEGEDDDWDEDDALGPDALINPMDPGAGTNLPTGRLS